ncbi:hypothetical protein LENED_004624 [Lentinula edodes]|uniref:Uncharacterized protein n=1 Tax=Lentinula edodes TaxID=5353 RepID=A0A1Q3E788_LENED|nr:hypothetical protein LENED_004624 [Lentinula edodes]
MQVFSDHLGPESPQRSKIASTESISMLGKIDQSYFLQNDVQGWISLVAHQTYKQALTIVATLKQQSSTIKA